MPRVIVLGTGTGVGKSTVTRALARALATLCPDASVGALKPIETGLLGAEGADLPEAGDSTPEPSDAAALSVVFQRAEPPVPHPLFGYAEPLTPYLAARRAGLPAPDLSEVRGWVEAWEGTAQQRHGSRPASRSRVWALVESAGGVFSPLAAGGAAGPVTNFELWRALEPCFAVLVARDGLGTLHDVTATLSALRARGRSPNHLVLSAAGAPDRSRGSNAAVLEALGIARPSAVLADPAQDLLELARSLLRSAEDA